jgi:hypothetical protein
MLILIALGKMVKASGDVYYSVLDALPISLFFCGDKKLAAQSESSPPPFALRPFVSSTSIQVPLSFEPLDLG